MNKDEVVGIMAAIIYASGRIGRNEAVNTAAALLETCEGAIEKLEVDRESAKIEAEFKKFENRPISDLGLRKSKRFLDKMGITTIGELCGKTDSDLLAYNGFGRVCLSEIEKSLHAISGGLLVLKQED